MARANKRVGRRVLQDTKYPSGSAPDHERRARGAALVEALGLVMAQSRRARGRRRLVFASADDGAHWVALLDSTGRMADRRITRDVARFAACADGRWPADSLPLPADTPTLAAADGVDVLMLRYGAPIEAEGALGSRGCRRRAL